MKRAASITAGVILSMVVSSVLTPWLVKPFLQNSYDRPALLFYFLVAAGVYFVGRTLIRLLLTGPRERLERDRESKDP